MLVFRGLTIVMLDGKSLSPFPKSFQLISSGFLPDYFQGEDVHWLSIVLGFLVGGFCLYFSYRRRRKYAALGFDSEPVLRFFVRQCFVILLICWFTMTMASYEGFPNVLVLLVMLVVIYHFITNKTVIGRSIYATGGNEKAALLSGIGTKKIRLLMFMNMGMLSAIAGLVFSARLNAATATAGNSFELDAIAACYIGGASAYGGIGTVLGAIIGGLVMGVLNNGMSLLGVGADWQQAIKGLVLLLAVAFDIYNKNKAGG